MSDKTERAQGSLDTQAMYDADASRWRRREPNSLSDFTGRPVLFELCGDVRGKRILDIGCGEGYCARELAARGATAIVGIELSEEMVALANKQESEAPLGIRYAQGDIRTADFGAEPYDLVVASFVFNYMVTDDMVTVMSRAARALRSGGTFVFTVPHPSLPFLKGKGPPFYFDFEGKGYFSGRDTKNQGEIWCRDGKVLRVQMVHKLIEDYFSAMAAAGFTRMPTVREMRVLPQHLALDPGFFGPVEDIPLHLGFRVERD